MVATDMVSRLSMAKVLLLFVDGVGLGSDDAAANPFVTASLPTLRGLVGNESLTAPGRLHHQMRASLVAIDAVLGVEGTPQSGTGQASLLTGVNAAALHGRHFGPWVPTRLRTLVRDESVLARALAAGYTVGFANAYPEEVTHPPREGAALLSDASADPAGGREVPARPNARERRTPSFLRAGPPLAALGAGLLTRHTPELERGDAIASEITNDGWRDRLGRNGVPDIDAAHAGRNLARIAARYDLTFFAHYATDYAGHLQDMSAAVAALEKLDAFLAGLLEEAAERLLVFVVSDHGNIEDVRTGHTRNPAIGLVIGKGHAPIARGLASLTDVAPAILNALAM